MHKVLWRTPQLAFARLHSMRKLRMIRTCLDVRSTIFENSQVHPHWRGCALCSCIKCDFSTTQTTHLWKHTARHTGDRPLFYNLLNISAHTYFKTSLEEDISAQVLWLAPGKSAALFSLHDQGWCMPKSYWLVNFRVKPGCITGNWTYGRLLFAS